MEEDFWHDRWQNNQIGFHETKPNPILIQHFHKLDLKDQSRIFVPLCGKTLDIQWLLSQGYRVVGVELSDIAIKQLFDGLGLVPEIKQTEAFKHYQAKNIDIFVGNFFDLTSSILGRVDAIYDRAALVALPEDMRKKYTKHLIEITHKAPYLLLTYSYDQSLTNGPPFSVDEQMVQNYYSAHYSINFLDEIPVPNGLRGQFPSTQSVWILKP
ncbi:thiopurine S-methyltransferase [Kiloniella litopenaei]|uniref:Thiopurine S-methyltransferase n=1 Tax=Kiloniella litopenaei TaxID=1549748 RepID=A0A0M2RA66_9PROT|nr:thiopurine S-methyltransferase [Kiloniella litopenaei]KKJ78707.1 thiopurine S-methyltransferase [Kiloniella litopenaei]